MEHYWLLPPPGAVKVNVHGATPFIPYPNGNTNSIGMVMRDAEGEFIKLSIGVLPAASALENKLNVIHHGLIKAFEDNYKEVILETDNLDAFKIIKNFPNGVPPELAEVARQIHIRLNDPRWFCVIVYVYPNRNKVAIYLARLGGERCNQLYTLTRPVGAVEELLSMDLGFGHAAPGFKDVVISNEEADPVDFGPNYLPAPGIIHGGYAFQEDYYAIDTPFLDGPQVLPVHEVETEDFIVGIGPNHVSLAQDFPNSLFQ